MSRSRLVAYWVTTVIVALILFSGGLSHVARDGAVGHVVWPLGLAALAVASWALRPESRILGTLLPKQTG